MADKKSEKVVDKTKEGKDKSKKEAKDKENPNENEYVLLVSKRIRAYKKKLTKVEELEKKVKEGGSTKINEDQKKVLESKEATQRALKDFEELRAALMKVQAQGEKEKAQQTEKAKETSPAATSVGLQGVRTLVSVVQLSNQLTESAVRERLSQKVKDSDLERIVHLGSMLTSSKSGPSFKENLDRSVQVAEKLVSHSEESVEGSTTYAQVAKQLEELVSLVSVKHEEPSVAPVSEQKAVAPVVSEEKSTEQSEETEEGSPSEAQNEGEEGEGQDNGFHSVERSRGGRGSGFRRGRRGSRRGGYSNEGENNNTEGEGKWETSGRPPRRGGAPKKFFDKDSKPRDKPTERPEKASPKSPRNQARRTINQP